MHQRQFFMSYGAFLGLLFVLVAVLFRAFGIIDLERPVLLFTLNTMIFTGFLFFSIKQYRDIKNQGIISYSQSLKVGVTIAVFSAIIFGFWKVLLVGYIDPTYSSLALEKQQQAILELDNAIPGMIDNIDETLDGLEQELASQYKPHNIIINEIIGKAVGGFLLSLIISCFTKKQDPELII